jgi:2-iminobutanoate/2-iminopropanoate deaminase
VSTHERRAVSTGKAPRAIGPYSQAIVAGGFVFCSGMIALDPTSGEMVGASDVAAQARRALDSLKALLEAAGSSMDRVVKTTIYLTDLGDFATVNEIYAGYFGAPPPARATVQVAGLPRGAMVEIDAIALVSASP